MENRLLAPCIVESVSTLIIIFWEGDLEASWHRRILGVGFFAAGKMTHLSRDETATKMRHPIVVAWSDLGHQPNGAMDGAPVRFWWIDERTGKSKSKSKENSRSLRDDNKKGKRKGTGNRRSFDFAKDDNENESDDS